MDGVEEIGNEDKRPDPVYLMDEGMLGIAVCRRGHAHENEVENRYLHKKNGEADKKESQVLVFFCAPIKTPQLQDIGDGIHD